MKILFVFIVTMTFALPPVFNEEEFKKCVKKAGLDYEYMKRMSEKKKIEAMKWLNNRELKAKFVKLYSDQIEKMRQKKHTDRVNVLNEKYSPDLDLDAHKNEIVEEFNTCMAECNQFYDESEHTVPTQKEKELNEKRLKTIRDNAKNYPIVFGRNILGPKRKKKYEDLMERKEKYEDLMDKQNLKKLAEAITKKDIGVRKNPKYSQDPNDIRGNGKVSCGTIFKFTETKKVQPGDHIRTIVFYKLADGRGWIHDFDLKNPKKPTIGQVKRLHFKPDFFGAVATKEGLEEGLVTHVAENSQAKQKGVTEGWVFKELNGNPWTHNDWKNAVKGNDGYSITFQIS